jgi:hypothetical protein
MEHETNTNIPDSRAFSFIYFNNNASTTTLGAVGTYVKIAGATDVNEKKKIYSYK